MSKRVGRQKLLLLSAVLLLLLPIVPSASAQADGPFLTGVAVWSPHLPGPMVPGEAYEVHGRLVSTCIFGSPSVQPEQLSGVEAYHLSVNTSHPGLMATISPASFVLEWPPEFCLQQVSQARDFTITLTFAADTPAFLRGNVEFLVEHDWGSDTRDMFQVATAFVGGVDVQVPPNVSLEPDVTTLVPLAFTNTANSPVVVDSDVTLRSLNGPQPDLPVFQLAVGETRVVNVPVVTTDTEPAAGVLEVRFDAYSVDDVQAAADIERVRVDLSVGDGFAPAGNAVEESPAAPFFISFVALGMFMLAGRRWRK